MPRGPGALHRRSYGPVLSAFPVRASTTLSVNHSSKLSLMTVIDVYIV